MSKAVLFFADGTEEPFFLFEFCLSEFLYFYEICVFILFCLSHFSC